MPDLPITAVPTNIITGFLGVGKTTAITHLLARKPKGERWAILVNEFGEIGVDGSLFQGSHGEGSGIFVREVPGGCMCCTAGLPMQIALNQLLARARPDRLLIEPTGLGHPLEVLQSLSAEHYRDVLDIQRTVTLVDARKLADRRYTAHDTFNQQIAMADVVVGNKQDLYGPGDEDRLRAYVRERCASGTELMLTRQGALELQWLEGNTAALPSGPHHFHGAPQDRGTTQPDVLDGIARATNEGEGYQSVGWRFDATHTFDQGRLFALLSGLEAERMKAVFMTRTGVFGYNLTPDGLTEIPLDDCLESRIEIIAPQVDPDWEARLLHCLAEAPVSGNRSQD